MFTYWHVSLKLQISAIPIYLKISNSTNSGKHSSNDIGGAVFVSVIFVTTSLRSCWARVILLTNAFPRDWALTKYFSFSSSQLHVRLHLVKFLPTRGTQTRITARCFHIKTIFHVFHKILNNAIPARRRFATTDVAFFLGSHCK